MKLIVMLGLLLFFENSLLQLNYNSRRIANSRYRRMRRLHKHRFVHSSGLSARYVGYTKTGLNVCGSGCCNGWSRSSTGQCTFPVCENQCQNVGKCVRPNLCRCPSGSLRSSCAAEARLSSFFKQANNLLTSQKQHRETRQSLVRFRPRSQASKSRIVRPSLSNTVQKRLRPKTSSSRSSFGKCYRSSGSSMCGVALRGSMSASLCCGGMGDAWGSRCTPCKLLTGISSSSSYSSQSLPYRINRRPSRRRKCRKGFKLYRHSFCRDVNECLKRPKKCEHGRCLNTPGSYLCSCARGYQRGKDKKSCLEKIEQTIGACYLNVDESGKCQSNTQQSMNRTECCCTFGSGWGEKCELCPSVGSEEKRKLCGSSTAVTNNLEKETATSADKLTTPSATIPNMRSTSSLQTTRSKTTVLPKISITQPTSPTVKDIPTTQEGPRSQQPETTQEPENLLRPKTTLAMSTSRNKTIFSTQPDQTKTNNLFTMAATLFSSINSIYAKTNTTLEESLDTSESGRESSLQLSSTTDKKLEAVTESDLSRATPKRQLTPTTSSLELTSKSLKQKVTSSNSEAAERFETTPAVTIIQTTTSIAADKNLSTKQWKTTPFVTRPPVTSAFPADPSLSTASEEISFQDHISTKKIISNTSPTADTIREDTTFFATFYFVTKFCSQLKLGCNR